MRPRNSVFITGAMRSGTTLLEKLINTHCCEACIHYQPLMSLFVEVKNEFLGSLGYERELYPLTPLFCETRYQPAEFFVFLEGYRPKEWPGLPSCVEPDKVAGKRLDEVLSLIWRSLGDGNLSESGAIEAFGAKEVLCEEYTPFLAKYGYNIIFVLRDPRDMIASMNYGSGAQHVGGVRPTLYNLRNWRKSVAYALYLDFLGVSQYVHYERVVDDPEGQIGRILPSRGRARKKTIVNSKEALKDSSGRIWSGNSSFQSMNAVSQSSVGRFRDKLPRELIEFVETVCEPEMRLLGYDLIGENRDRAKVLRDFSEPISVTHHALPHDYSKSPIHIRHELERMDILRSRTNVSADELGKYFIFPEVGEILIENMQGNVIRDACRGG